MHTDGRITSEDVSGILVIGDSFCDSYQHGHVTRLSPEAPVPVFIPGTETIYLGGAANVFHNCVTLGGRAQLCTLVGDDAPGKTLREKLSCLYNDPALVITDPSRCTSVKTRLLADGHRLLRIDRESDAAIDLVLEHETRQIVQEAIGRFDVLVISDYNKGFLTEALVGWLIDRFHGLGKRVLVDPKCALQKYRNAYLIKPNQHEFLGMTGRVNVTDVKEVVEQYGDAVLQEGNFEYMYVTLGKQGGILKGKDGQTIHVPAYGIKAQDMTGAGDTVIAALAVALARGSSVADAVHFASRAAGVSVSKPGTATVTPEDLNEDAYR